MISGRRREPSAAATSAAVELAGEAEEPDIEGADAGGTTSDLLVGDKEEVRARREACRRKQKALRSEAEEEEDALIEAERRLVRPRIDDDTLARDVAPAPLAQMGCEKSAEHLRTAERAWEEFASTHECVPASDEYPSVDSVKKFAASMTRTRLRACLAQRDSEEEPARAGVASRSSRNWLKTSTTRTDQYYWLRRVY